MLKAHPSPVKTGLEILGKFRVQTTFGDGVELVEEYDVADYHLISRKWRENSVIQKQLNWEYEIGDPPQELEKPNCKPIEIENSINNPSWHSYDKRSAWEWHVQNIPYEISIYTVSIDEDKTALILRTMNRKYYKKWKIPLMCRLEQLLSEDNIELRHIDNTLIISYRKPEIVKTFECQEVSELKELKASGGFKTAQNDKSECRQS